MKRKKKLFFAFDHHHFIEKLVHWLFLHEHFSLFNGNHYRYPFGPFHTFAAAGSVHTFNKFDQDPFQELIDFHENHRDWLVGRFSYDLKNYIETLTSSNTDRLNSTDIYFFVPTTLIFLHTGHIEIQSFIDPDRIWAEIQTIQLNKGEHHLDHLRSDMKAEDYIKKVTQIKTQIIEGDFYEVNFCIEYYYDKARIHPPGIYNRLNSISPMPFSVFQGLDQDYILSASPERFLKKSGRTLIAQPIKGTMRRDPDPVIDESLKKELEESEKEIAENMMIVDLMRNDLAKSALPGTVKVPELFRVYSFPLLHQMISTITCELKNDTHPVKAIKHTFPMGSMTGAPKIRAMQEIEKYESSKRGTFSGATGYFSPDGDFDFNVLIRSIFYNKNSSCLKFNVGSAITYDADPEYEYMECQLKAKAIIEALKPSG